MGKREKKLEVIRKYIGNASGDWDAYTYGKIPANVARGACSTYCGANIADILGLIDITILDTGKKGIVFTEHKIYYDNGIMSGKGSISYQKLHETGVIPDGLLNPAYNNEALKEMISNLVRIDNESVSDTITKGIDDANKTMDTALEWIDKASSFLNKLDSLLGTKNNNEQNK